MQPTDLQQLLDAVMSVWTKISKESFQHTTFQYTSRENYGRSEGKRGLPFISKMDLIKWTESECKRGETTQHVR